MAVQRLAAWEEVDDFLTSTPTPEQIIAFRLSKSSQARLIELLAKNRANALTLSETEELDQILAIDTFMGRLKAKAFKKGRD
jgi:hypothetical protein